ncbi:MAG TPA: hypothetical protein VNX68_00280, partial [Nitrosopumilaceae archaeon]|nr:hypothetical protein [Nitrosopumilaceae archaeon]
KLINEKKTRIFIKYLVKYTPLRLMIKNPNNKRMKVPDIIIGSKGLIKINCKVSIMTKAPRIGKTRIFKRMFRFR